MKLFHRVILTLSLGLLPVMALWSVLFYYGMVNEINDEADDTLGDYAQLVMNTSLTMKNLCVKSAHTTNNGGDNDGAISLTCTVDGKTITVRTAVLVNEDNSIVTQDAFVGKTIDVYGIIDSYNGEYQIKVFKKADITIH